MLLGEYLKKIRGDKTIGQISQRSGIDKGYLSKIERNERNPKPDMLEQLAEAYGGDYHKMMEICGYLSDPVIVRRVRRLTEKMDEAQQARMMDILKSNFNELFDDEEDDDYDL